MPTLYIIAGPNGAGKTTAAMTLLPDFLHIKEFVNADEIARGLSPFNVEGVALQAGRLMLKRMQELIMLNKVLCLKQRWLQKHFPPYCGWQKRKIMKLI